MKAAKVNSFFKRWMTNRQRRLSPRLGEFWCSYCDRGKVSIGGKCKLCGHKHERQALKRQPF
ncbi:hypothetical protein HNP46_005736 [Pseudomonas nitritireducens]|uniref:Uncharacterized protein n=1 Tax=Pseudomonas nitroreducens TaxID=46680 RepID=A0A7W7KQR5_PSENT|nr:hypothetical protein [Pseudomonas nitritireducens]MBB4866829.1 hypothetical protein [Pseudomonas nitritireducens]